MVDLPIKPEKALTRKQVQIIIVSGIILIALGWGIFKDKHHDENKKGNVIKFANYNTDLLLEEQNAYHNDIKKKIEINNSNFQTEIESQEKTNETLYRHLQNLEKLPSKTRLIKGKWENTNEKADILNVPSSY
jgi:GTP-dependent phosphoenolpyruvate carboxykinase